MTAGRADLTIDVRTDGIGLAVDMIIGGVKLFGDKTEHQVWCRLGM